MHNYLALVLFCEILSSHLTHSTYSLTPNFTTKDQLQFHAHQVRKTYKL